MTDAKKHNKEKKAPEKQEVNHLDEQEPRWFAVYTNYKREKLVHRLLTQKGIHSYLPLQKVVRRYTRKIKRLEIPLISCYIFVKIVKGQYVPVLETEHVLRFVRFSRNLISIPEEEIDIIRRVVGEGIEVEAQPTSDDFAEGDEVEIISGNLTGLHGKLVSIEGKNRFVVDLETMGYSLKMNVEPSLLRKV